MRWTVVLLKIDSILATKTNFIPQNITFKKKTHSLKCNHLIN